MEIASLLIIISAFLLLWGYLLYPISLWFLAKIFNSPVSTAQNFQPDITIIISAYNEQEFIADAIDSIYNSGGYPSEKIKVLAGSDGSSDKTYEILTKLSEKYPSLTVFNFDRIGKNSVINALLEKATTAVVFFMDADIRLQKNTIETLLPVLADSSVGAVIASMKSLGDTDESAGGFGEILYQKIETKFRIYESKIYSTVNALGAFYGVKIDLLEFLPDNLVPDDFYPLLVVMEKKKRVIFVKNAEVLEVRPKSTGDEFSRRIRVSASSMSALKDKFKLLLPHYGWVAYFLFCHKVLRWATPMFLIIILISTFFVENRTFLLVIVAIQLYIYGGAILGYLAEKVNFNFVLLKLPLYSVLMSLGFLGAFFRFISRSDNSKWQHP